MKALLIICSLIFNLSVFAENQEVLRISGKFVIKKGIEGLNTELYFRIKEKSGKSYAYPVRISDKALESKVLKDLKKIYTIEAVAKQISFKVNETTRFVHVLDVKTASKFDLKSLGVSDKDSLNREPDIPYYDRENPASNGYKVSDKAANSIIFAAGAAILGALLVK
jgi:hypothetical protein